MESSIEPTTDLERVSRRLGAIRASPGADLHVHFSPALDRFRFIPRADRRACADEFATWAGGHGDRRLAAYAVFLQAIDRFIDEQHADSLGMLVKARAAFTDLGDAEGLGLTAMLIGAVYRTFGNFDLALRVLWEGYDLLRSSGRYPVFLAATANSLANIHLDSGRPDEALPMFETTLSESRRANDFYFAVYALHGMGRILRERGETDEGERLLREALDLSERHAHPLHTSNSLTELAAARLSAGDLDAAEALNLRALDVRERHRLLAGAVTNGIRLGEIRLRQGRWDEARKDLERALATATELGVKPKMAQVHHLLSELAERTGDAALALAHHKRFHELRHAVDREDAARRLEDARLVFESEQTRKENAVIRQQKAEIERKNVELQDTIDELTRAKIGRKARAFTLGLTIVLFIFQDAILRAVLGVLTQANYFELLAVKMAIIFSLAPINRGIERYLLRRVLRAKKQSAGALDAPVPAES